MSGRADKVLDIKNGIGLLNEKSLHASLKEWYSIPGDRFEVKVENFVVDIVRDGLLIEVQTKNLSSISRKLRKLVKKYEVKLIYPIAKEKWIIKVSPTNGKFMSRRKSPKRGVLTDIFEELVHIPNLISDENFKLEVLMIQEEEVRCNDGKGSWWRKGASIKDRKLIDVVEQVEFNNPWDFLEFIPQNIKQPFTNRDLSQEIELPIWKTAKITYCLKKMGVIREAGKFGSALLFEIIKVT